MKDVRTLVALLVAAAAAGGALYYLQGSKRPRGGVSFGRVVEEAVGLRFGTAPVVVRDAPGELAGRIGGWLDRRFGPGGLVHRTRVMELLGLLPPGRNLRDGFLAMETAGARGWFDPVEGGIHVLDDFDPARPADRAALHGLLALALLAQHAPRPAEPMSDDAWLARRGLHRAVAAVVEERTRAADPGQYALPSSAETEREAILLALPIYVHNIAQFGNFEVREFLDDCLGGDPGALPGLVRNPPATTLELLGGGPARIDHPPLPSRPGLVFEEGLGAFGVRILVEWLADYDRAVVLSRAWRGDRYGLFADGAGDHVVWVCRWDAAGSAAAAVSVLAAGGGALPGRHRALRVRGAVTLLADCADAGTLSSLLAEWDESDESDESADPGSPSAPGP